MTSHFFKFLEDFIFGFSLVTVPYECDVIDGRPLLTIVDEVKICRRWRKYYESFSFQPFHFRCNVTQTLDRTRVRLPGVAGCQYQQIRFLRYKVLKS